SALWACQMNSAAKLPSTSRTYNVLLRVLQSSARFGDRRESMGKEPQGPSPLFPLRAQQLELGAGIGDAKALPLGVALGSAPGTGAHHGQVTSGVHGITQTAFQ